MRPARLLVGLSLLALVTSSRQALAVAPTATNMNAAEAYTEDVAKDLVDIVVSDVDNATTTARLTLSNINAGSLTTGTSGAVTSTYNAGTGVWEASGPIPDVNVLLAGVTFVPSINFNFNFVITTLVDDGTGGTVTGSKNVTGTPVNDAPTLDASKSPALGSIGEDPGAPSGAVGTLVSSLVDFASPAGQLDNVTDPDGGGLLGIAVIMSDPNVTLYYSLNGGASWTALGAVSPASARTLAADADNRIYAQPAANVNGSFASALTIRAWDMTTGVDGGPANTTTNGGTSAFSIQTDGVALTVTAVNDAPQATNLNAPESYTEDTSLNLTDIVASDVDNSILTASLTLSNPAAGSLTTATSGPVTSTFAAGVWTASGPTANVNTLLAGVNFVPAANFNGNFTIGTSVSDGALSSNGNKIVTGTAVNDAPALDASRSPALDAITEDPGAPSGPVGTLVSSLVDFASPPGQVDNVTDPDAGAVTGIAITALDPGFTAWMSLNGGTTWTAIGTPTTTAARTLSADADNRIYLQPAPNVSGSFSSAITFRAWDMTTGVDGGPLDTSTNGGASSVSSATDGAALTVTAVNDPPQASNVNAAENYTEDTPLDLTDIVASDVDNATITATLTVSNPAAGSLTTATSGPVTSTFSAGVWTASGPTANVNALLAGVNFVPAANFNANFSIGTDVSDGALSVSGSKAMTGVAVNDAPALDASRSPALVAVAEDAPAPSGAVGTLVSALVDFASPAGQLDNVTDPDTGAETGIAIVGIDPALTLYVSLDGGTNWIAAGTPGNANARTLLADADNRVYLQPGANASGSFASALTFRAWDKTAGVDNGPLDTSTNGGSTSVSTATDVASLTVTAVNDPPQASNLNAPESYTEDTPLNLADIVASDVDSPNVTATLTLSNPSAGSLTTATSGAVTSTFAAGVWTASGFFGDVNTLLAGVSFVPATNFNANFSIGTNVSDGALSVSGSKVMTGVAVNDAPTLDASKSPALAAVAEDAPAPSGAVGTLVSALVDFAGGGGALDNVADPDAGAVAGIAITGLDPGFTAYMSLNGGTTWTPIGSPSPVAARTLSADADNRVFLQPAANVNGSFPAALTFRAWDMTNGVDGGPLDTSTNGGTSSVSAATDVAALTVTAQNDPPAASNLNAAESYTEDVPLDLTDIVASDVDNATVTATLTMSNVSAGALSTGTSGAVTSTYVSGTGVWSASGPTADVNVLLAGVTFTPAPNFNANFAILTNVSDGASSTGGSKAVTGTAVNDAPVLDPGASPALDAVAGDAGSPAGAVGTPIANLVDLPGGGGLDNVSEVDAGALTGIAIVGADQTNGTFFFTANGGSSWASLGTVSTTSARLLAADANCRVYFQPAPGFSGTIVGALTFRAWDRTFGVSGLVTSTASNGGTSAYSSATDAAPIEVTSSNHAPLLGNGVLAAVPQDTADPPGETIAAIFAGQFTDPDPGAGLSGIAVAGNGADALVEGSWQFSSNAGGTWSNVGVVSGAEALVLAADSKVRFLPVAGFTGAPGDLIVHGLDDTYAGGFSTTVDPATRVTLDASLSGGSTAVAQSPATLSTTITSLIGAPAETLPLAFALGAASPNPSGGAVVVPFALPRDAHVRISLVDLRGREVAVLADGVHPAGFRQVRWDGRTPAGRAAAGVYFVRCETPAGTFVRKLIRVSGSR